DLTWRDVKYLLAVTAKQLGTGSSIDLSGVTQDLGWQTNAEGFTFNNNYGFGVVDVSELVSTARNYTPGTLSSYLQKDTLLADVSGEIPNGTAVPLMVKLSSDLEARVETVRLVMDVDHDHPKDLTVILESPSGTRSVLLSMDSAYLSLEYPLALGTNAFYRESAKGEWTISVYDMDGDENSELDWFPNLDSSGSLNSIRFEIMAGD
ncbi:MAG: proprotein convertase P-domain-containing protein, partial [Betaproteobacteria bacterium]